jgi:hypothetical protein
MASRWLRSDRLGWAQLFLWVLAIIWTSFAVASAQDDFFGKKKTGAVSEPWIEATRKPLTASLAVGAVAFAAAALGARRLASAGASPTVTAADRIVPVPRWEIAALAALMIAPAVFNGPRLGQSLWLDEEFSLRHFMVGEFTPRATASEGESPRLRWNPVTLQECLWDYRSPNNHGLYSLLAKLSHGGAKHPTAPGATYFVPWRLRLPAFVAAILAVPAVWYLMRRLGFPAAPALAAPLFMVLHPWYVRYSTEARSYGLLLLLWPVAAICLLNVLATRRWRWWLAFALTEGLLAWSWFNNIYWLAALNVPLAVAAWQARGRDRAGLLVPWITTGLLTAALFLPFILPGLLQVVAWVNEGRGEASVEYRNRMMADAFTVLLTGEPWHSADPDNPLCPGRFADAAARPAWLMLAFALPIILFAAGLLGWKRRGPRGFLAVLLLPLPLLFAHASLRGSLIMHWYPMPSLVAFTMLAAAGAHQIACLLPAITRPFTTLALTTVSCLAAQPAAQMLRIHEVEPNLAATRLTRSILNPSHPDCGKDAITGALVQPRRAYDPHIASAKSPDDLRRLMQQATLRNVPFFIHLGDVKRARAQLPDAMRIVENPSLFRPVATLHGLDHAQTRHVWQWTGKLPEEP